MKRVLSGLALLAAVCFLPAASVSAAPAVVCPPGQIAVAGATKAPYCENNPIPPGCKGSTLSNAADTPQNIANLTAADDALTLAVKQATVAQLASRHFKLKYTFTPTVCATVRSIVRLRLGPVHYPNLYKALTRGLIAGTPVTITLSVDHNANGTTNLSFVRFAVRHGDPFQAIVHSRVNGGVTSAEAVTTFLK